MSQIVKLFAVYVLLYCYSVLPAISQSIKPQAEESASTYFTVPGGIYPSPAWVLSSALKEENQADASILSQLDPLWQENLLSGKFEQIQSIIIPGGIIDVVNDLVYLENTSDDVVVLDLKTGQTKRHIKSICCPVAIIDDRLIALSTTKAELPMRYDLLMLDSSRKVLARWGTISLPEWLALPGDGERQKFIFNAHCYQDVLSVAWQASRRQVFPNPLSLIIPAMAQPAALKGNFSCDLKNQTIISQSIEDGDSDFLGYLTADENLPAQVALDADTVAIRKYNYFLFALVRSYPPEHNISSAGVVAKVELRVKDMRTGKVLWSHILPASFMPLAI